MCNINDTVSASCVSSDASIHQLHHPGSNGGSYVMREADSLEDAEWKCEEMGYNLTNIETQQEFDAIANFLTSSGLELFQST